MTTSQHVAPPRLRLVHRTEFPRLPLLDDPAFRLAPRIAVERRAFDQQSPAMQQRLRCLAIARSSYTAVLVGLSAARVHGLWVRDRREERVELALPCGQYPRNGRDCPQRRYRKTPVAGHVVVDGARVVPLARAVVDVARYHGFIDGLLAADSALRRGASAQELEAALQALGRVRGASVVRRVIAAADGRCPSRGESLARGYLLEHFGDGVYVQPGCVPLPGIPPCLAINRRIAVAVDAEFSAHQRSMLRRRGWAVVEIPLALLGAYPEVFVARIDGLLHHVRAA